MTIETVSITCMRCGESVVSLDDEQERAAHTGCRPSVRRSVSRAVNERLEWMAPSVIGAVLAVLLHMTWYGPLLGAALYIAAITAYYATPHGRRRWIGSPRRTKPHDRT